MVRRLLWVAALAASLLAVESGAAFACGGLVAPGHAEALQKATTLVVWHDGYEHYITSFEFAGLANTFGYIIPLPGVPTKIQRGGNWTLERVEGEIGQGPLEFKANGGVALEAAAAPSVQVLQQVKIDALNITIVRGGGSDVANWAKRNGFDLTPDAPRVLGAYSKAGAVFALAKFNRVDAKQRGLVQGQGEVIQFTISTKAPWVPFRILALGKAGPEFVDADVFVLTDARPSFFPSIGSLPGMTVRKNAPASSSLLADLSSDRGMNWVPSSGMWFTALTLHTTAPTVNYDLSIDGGGPAPSTPGYPIPVGFSWPLWLAPALGGLAILAIARRERGRARLPAR